MLDRRDAWWTQADTWNCLKRVDGTGAAIGVCVLLVGLSCTTPLTSSETILSTLQAAIESDYQIKISSFFTLAREVSFDTLDVPVYLG